MMLIWCRSMRKQYVLLSHGSYAAAGTSTWWPGMPRSLALAADMRDRQVIDAAFADHAVSAIHRVENRFRCFAVVAQVTAAAGRPSFRTPGYRHANERADG